MKLIRTFSLAGLALILGTTSLYATDYFVTPTIPGPVTGAPLAAISLSATLPAKHPAGSADKAVGTHLFALPDADAMRAPSTDAALQRGTDGADLAALDPTLVADTASPDVIVPMDAVDTSSSDVSALASDVTSPSDVPTNLQTTVDQTGNTDANWVPVSDVTTTPPPSPSPVTTTTTTTTTITTAPVVSAANTYPNFDALIATGKLKAGDRVFLRGGKHGYLRVNGLQFSAPVIIAGMPGEVAQVESIIVYNSTFLVFRDLKVWRTDPAITYKSLIRSMASTSDIVFTNLDIRASIDSTNYVNWDKAKWAANKYNGLDIDGPRSSAIGNRLTGVNFGITTSGRYALIEKNIVDGFSGDGMRAIGDDSIIRGNRVQNCVVIDRNHADGFQSWSRGAGGKAGTGTLYNLRIENNKIYEWNLSQVSPLKCGLQGIGMFTGMYENVTISNNMISTSVYHGIAIYGGKNVLITQNTVSSPTNARKTYPWIKIARDGDTGTPSSNVMVANNVANMIDVPVNTVNNVQVANNTTVTNPSTEFTNPLISDFTLLPTAKAANTGSATYQTATDLLGVARPKGPAPDAGAYEDY